MIGSILQVVSNSVNFKCINFSHGFLALLAQGQQAIAMALCQLCVSPFSVGASVTFSFENSITFDWIFTKFHSNVP